MSNEMDKRLVFAFAPSMSTLMIGIPREAWEAMLDGSKTQDLDLTKLGVPLRLMIFGSETHDTALAYLTESCAKEGIAVRDERRRDFSIKGEGDG